MRILVVNTDYSKFIAWLYAQHPDLAERSYQEQGAVRASSLFGVADFYSYNLGRLGYEANDVYANNPFMQMAWAREHDAERNASGPDWIALLRRRVPRRAVKIAPRRLRSAAAAMLRKSRPLSDELRILALQVRHWKPDVVLNQAIEAAENDFWKELRPYIRLLIGQHAARLPGNTDLSSYDVMISSLPNLVEYFRSLGVPSELHRFGFDERVLGIVGAQRRDMDVSFIGSLSSDHENRRQLLEAVCSTMNVGLWGRGVEEEVSTSPLSQAWRGEAWGREMFTLLSRSRITLNVHQVVAGRHANNMRLFEATGMGALLVTDERDDLAEIFEPGREVVSFRDPDDCVEVLEYYLANTAERERISAAGQQRVLTDHTYLQRMEELDAIIRRYMP